MIEKVLLIVGSPRLKKSTSEALGDYILEKLKQKGVDTKKIKIDDVLKEEGGIKKLIFAINNSDFIIFSSPLYVDSLPANVTRALEIIADNRKEKDILKKQSILAICNCGFPEAAHNHTALAIYKCFAKESGFEWAGGLALGGGEAIGGKPINKTGWIGRNLLKSLDLVADAVFEGKTVPEKAVKLIEKPIMPNWLYLFVGRFGWIFQAKKYDARKKINDQPYQK